MRNRAPINGLGPLLIVLSMLLVVALGSAVALAAACLGVLGPDVCIFP